MAILDDVGQGLTQQTGITHHHSPVRIRIKIGVEIHLLGFVQGNLTMRQRGKRQFFHQRLRHAGKIGKFINHAADIIDLTPDDRQILAELLAFCLVLWPVFTPQPVRRKLDRGERILISCAIRRATSDQAALRCAVSRSVTSSNVTT